MYRMPSSNESQATTGRIGLNRLFLHDAHIRRHICHDLHGHDSPAVSGAARGHRGAFGARIVEQFMHAFRVAVGRNAGVLRIVDRVGHHALKRAHRGGDERVDPIARHQGRNPARRKLARR